MANHSQFGEELKIYSDLCFVFLRLRLGGELLCQHRGTNTKNEQIQRVAKVKMGETRKGRKFWPGRFLTV